MPVINHCLLELVDMPSCLTSGMGAIGYPGISAKLLSDLTRKDLPYLESVFEQARLLVSEEIPSVFAKVISRRAALCDGNEVLADNPVFDTGTVALSGQDVWKVSPRLVRIDGIKINVVTPGVFQFDFGGYLHEEMFTIPGVHELKLPWLEWIGGGELTIGWTSPTGVVSTVAGYSSSDTNVLNPLFIGSGISYRIAAECSWLPIVCTYKYSFVRAMKLGIAAYLLDAAIQHTGHVESALLKQPQKASARDMMLQKMLEEIDFVASKIKLDCCDECIHKNTRIQYKTTY